MTGKTGTGRGGEHTATRGAALAGLAACVAVSCFGGTPAGAGGTDAVGPAGDPGTFEAILPATCLPSGDPRLEEVETLCDQVDNDCDGRTDVLLPVEANACDTGRKGACAAGHAACVDGQRVCLGPPAVAETRNGVDDDCDGTTDEVDEPAAPLPLRARVLVPPEVWADGSLFAAGLAEVLSQAGIPFDALAPDAPDSLKNVDPMTVDLAAYSLVIVPGWVSPGALPIALLEEFVSSGGVLIWFKPVPPDAALSPEERAAQMEALDLAGLEGGERRTDVARVRLTPDVPGMLYLDTPEERDLPLTPGADAPGVFTYTPAAGTTVFARAFDEDGTDLGATFLRRTLGSGAVYSLGFDAVEGVPMRCYVNCFDPGRDELAMLLKGVYRESARGHAVLKHTVPGPEDAVLLLTHDLCAPDAQNPGEWGEAGALQMARMEVGEGVVASHMDAVDYVVPYYSVQTLKALCDLGMCPDGTHSVQHPNMVSLPEGDCSVTKATYDTGKPTVCGEVSVSVQQLDQSLPADQPVVAWRAPYLSIAASLYTVLDRLGIRYDSSWGLGDLRTSQPVSVARFPVVPAFQGQPIFTFPIAIEDGLGDEQGNRTELAADTQRQFLSLWTSALLGNAGNGAWSTALVHPSHGLGYGPENLLVKVDSVRRLARQAKARGLHLGRIGPLGDFWRGRDAARIEARYDPAKGTYEGTLTTGDADAPSFSLEFGDVVTSFDCPAGGAATVSGRRVVFAKLAANGTYPFTARTR